jgi:uncharacterized protein YceK
VKRALISAAALLALCGCGTIADSTLRHMNGPRVCGGVRGHLVDGYFRMEGFLVFVSLFLLLVDLPLSAAADTLILPYTIPHDLSKD